MKKIIITVLLMVSSASVFAWTIGPMNYQGRLLDDAGVPVTGSYNFTVKIYDALTGGALKFSENQNNIAVNDGVYSFLVSTGVTQSGSWDINLWNTPSLYLEIVVNGQALTPRHLLAAAPFAFQANLALTTNNALALGGKSAGNVLQDICKAGKGKWLELSNQCLGVGAAFPGPAMVNLNTLTASTDLSNLDLTNADIRGINFAAANFTGTLFKGTTMNGAGVGSANMTDTVWDGVVVTGTKTFSNNFTGANIGNTDMSGWNMSGAVLTGSSMANLIACPASLPASPAQYRCRDTGWSESYRYIILGPGMNLSNTSLVKDIIDEEFNPYGTVFNNLNSNLVPIPVNLTGANFSGNILKAPFLKVDLAGANFSRAVITQSEFESCNLAGANFNQSVLRNTRFYGVQGNGSASFAQAELNTVEIGTGDEGTTVQFYFGNAILDAVEFTQWDLGVMQLDFSGATLKNVSIDAAVDNLYAIGTYVYGGLYMGSFVTGVSFENMHFINGNLSGNWSNISDASSYYTNVSFNGADLTGSIGFDTNVYKNVSWFGATCPDGYQVTTLGGSCVEHFLP